MGDIRHNRHWGERTAETKRRALGKLTAGVPLQNLVNRRMVRAPELVMLNRSRSPVAERFKEILSILHDPDEEASRVLLVTSPSRGEGKSTVATNLALAFAAGSPGQVLLIDGDLRNPRLASWLDPAPQIGLTELLSGTTELDHVILELGNTPLRVLAAGRPGPETSELYETDHAASVLISLRQRFRRIIVDTPPILPTSDVSVIGRLADGAIVVVRAGVTRTRTLRRALASLGSTHVLGTLLNDATLDLAERRVFGLHRKEFPR